MFELCFPFFFQTVSTFQVSSFPEFPSLEVSKFQVSKFSERDEYGTDTGQDGTEGTARFLQTVSHFRFTFVFLNKVRDRWI